MTTTENQNEECVKLFTKTLAELNSISIRQLEGLLNIAVAAVEKVGAGDSATDAQRFVEEHQLLDRDLEQVVLYFERASLGGLHNTTDAVPRRSGNTPVRDQPDIALLNVERDDSKLG